MVKQLKNDRNGSAMIVALVVGAVITAFCLSLLLVCYSLYAQTVRQTMQMQCDNLAQTFAKEIKQEIESEETAAVSSPSQNIRDYLLSQIEQDHWKSADSDEEDDDTDDAKNDYNLGLELKASSDDLGAYTILVEMYYENGEKSVEGTISSYDIYMRVTCYRGMVNDMDYQSYTVYEECTLKKES